MYLICYLWYRDIGTLLPWHICVCARNTRFENNICIFLKFNVFRCFTNRVKYQLTNAIDFTLSCVTYIYTYMNNIYIYIYTRYTCILWYFKNQVLVICHMAAGSSYTHDSSLTKLWGVNMWFMFHDIAMA